MLTISLYLHTPITSDKYNLYNSLENSLIKYSLKYKLNYRKIFV